MKNVHFFSTGKSNLIIILSAAITGLILYGCQADDRKSSRSAVVTKQTVRKVLELSGNWKFQLDVRDIGRTIPEKDGARISCIITLANETAQETEAELNVSISRISVITDKSVIVRRFRCI